MFSSWIIKKPYYILFLRPRNKNISKLTLRNKFFCFCIFLSQNRSSESSISIRLPSPKILFFWTPTCSILFVRSFRAEFELCFNSSQQTHNGRTQAYKLLCTDVWVHVTAFCNYGYNVPCSFTKSSYYEFRISSKVYAYLVLIY
jgi:hypothetical protein